MPKPTKAEILLSLKSPVHLGMPEVVQELHELLKDSLEDFPDCCEGLITLGGVEHFYVYQVEGDVVHLSVVPREHAEEILNKIGLSTIEEWSPWPGRSLN